MSRFDGIPGDDIRAMFEACSLGRLGEVRELLEKNARLGACSWGYFTPFHFAVREGHVELVKLLLLKGANAAEKPVVSWHDSPLQIAADRGYGEIAEILDKNIEGRKNGDVLGRTALHEAARNGHLKLVKELLEQGADPNEAEEGAPRGAALYAAASGGFVDIARLLLEHGADVNAEVEASGDAMYVAMRKGLREMAALLTAYGGTLSLTNACALGRLDLVGELLAGRRLAGLNDGDYGPLTQAVGFGHREIIALLLAHGADMNLQWYASNYMIYAFRESRYDFVNMFLERGADPNLANWVGVGYLHLLAMQGEIEMAKLLLDYGANLHAVDDEYCTTPLGWAAKYGHFEMAHFLIDQGASANPDGVPAWATPAAWANRKGHSAIAQLLAR